MSNKINRKGNYITISEIDSDWSWSDIFPNYNGIKLQSIRFNPAATDDVCVIKEGDDTADAPHIFDCTGEDVYDQRYQLYHGVESRPVLDFSAGVYTAGSSVTIIINPYGV